MAKAKAKEEPKCTEVVCSSSVGGKVQIVRYEYTADFNYSISRKYDVPSGWNEQDVKDFQQDKEIELRGLVEGLAEAEMEELLKEKDELKGELGE